jgi:hypothetical protein
LETLEANWINMINGILAEVNYVVDFVFLVVGAILIIGYPVIFLLRSVRKISTKKQLSEMMTQTAILSLVAFIMFCFWALPELTLFWLTFSDWINLLPKWTELSFYFTVFRWIGIAIVFFMAAYRFGHEYGKKRWLYSALGHIVIVFIGLFTGKWVGILFISTPLLVTYYIALYNIANVILPASNPEDHKEKRKRFNILASYTWGTQSPLIVTDDNAWEAPEIRIPGDFTWDFSEFPIPIIENLKWKLGLIWMRSHQVASITSGIKFKRVDGPGVVYTGAMERPEQIFDLRLQLRTNEIDVVSKDGISFIVRVFTGFRLDPEVWDKDLYDKLRPMNSLLRGADKPSHITGSFPYSNLRVQAALGTTSTKATDNNPIIYWDQWAINVIEDQTRKTISQKNLDELWRPVEDAQFVNALDLIANEIKGDSELVLRTAGILLVVARVVNFRFKNRLEEDALDDISKQQLETWEAEWERNRVKILSKAQADAERAQQEARSYAESLLLSSIGNGLQKAKDMDPNLPRYVIAMRFLSSLQDYIHKQPEEKRIEELQNSFIELQEQFSPSSSKEK